VAESMHHPRNRLPSLCCRDGLFDITAASTRLGCSERFLRRLVQERRIPFVKLGGTKIRFQPRELDRWVAGQVVGAKR
jgi:excisionase family DNA binding protein